MTVPMVSLIPLVHFGPFRNLLNKINQVEPPTRAPGTHQLLLTNFIWVPVCIKKPADSYNLLAVLYAYVTAPPWRAPRLPEHTTGH